MCNTSSILSYDSKLMNALILDFKHLSLESSESFYECAFDQELMTLLYNLKVEFPELKSIIDRKLSQIGYQP